MFLLASPVDNRELTEVNLIDHALVKIFETGGFYTKDLKNYNTNMVAAKEWTKTDTKDDNIIALRTSLEEETEAIISPT